LYFLGFKKNGSIGFQKSACPAFRKIKGKFIIIDLRVKLFDLIDRKAELFKSSSSL